MGGRISIIMYHYVRELRHGRYSGIKGLETDDFKRQLDFLQANFNLVTVEELLAAVDEGAGLPDRAVLLTFDDGYIDHYTNVFPVLKERGIQGFFSMPGKILAERKVLDVNKIHFILASVPIERLLPMVFAQLDFYRGQEFSFPSNEELYRKLAVANRFDPAEVVFVKRLLQAELDERLRGMITDKLFREAIGIDEESFARELYMSLDQVRLMQREGMCFGIHGYDHYWMNRLDTKKLEEDIAAALDVFAGVVPENWICCYPYGSYSDEVISCAKAKGAVLGLGTDVRIADIEDDDRFKLPRLDTNDFPPKSERYKEWLSA